MLIEAPTRSKQPLTVYVLKDQLKEQWYAPTEEGARSRWEEWFGLAMGCCLGSL
jgi:transposase